jgi:YHS domain-containing protein
MGGKIDKTSYVDVAGKRIYLCCAGCADAVKAEPEKYIKKLEGEGVTLDVAAPVADKKK